MDPEKENNKIGDEQEGFGKVVDVLHKKSKLPHLRTYQGDMAEFIKEKNESVISVSLKEKKRREEKEEEKLNEKIERERQEPEFPIKNTGQSVVEKIEPIQIHQKITEIPKEITKEITNTYKKPKKNSRGIQTNLIITISSILLLSAGVYAIFNVFDTLKYKGDDILPISQGEIIPYTNLVTISNVTRENFRSQIEGISIQNGINILKISDTNGAQIKTSEDFFKFLGILTPGSLERDVSPDFAFGKIKRDDVVSTFLVVQIKDFGRAFSSLLEWEKKMLNDLSFMKDYEEDVLGQNLEWRDIIIKNKDSRALTNQGNQIMLIYTFLDRNTILITTSSNAIEDINNSFLSRSFVR